MKNKLPKGNLFLLLICVCLISCKKKNEAVTFLPKLDTQTKCKIQIAGNYFNFEALEADFDRFNEYYPNVELSFNYLDNYKKTISTALAGADAPDIFMTFPWMLDKSNYNGLIDYAENLADPKTTGIELSAINQKLIYYRPDGSLPMLPIFCSASGMLINEDIFKKEGFEIPKDYKELIDVCQKFKDSGYKRPIMTHYSETSIMASLIYSLFTKEVMNDKEAIAKLNELKPEAGEYMRPVLEWVEEFKKYGFIDFDECSKIENNYSAVIMRFFEGDVPIMLATTDTVSGTKKRKPFKYSFYAVPVMENKALVLEVSSIDFSVNKYGKNLEMANEFMRFLFTTQELNNIAMIKRLITCSTVYSFDDIYAPLGNAECLYQLEIGLLDNTYTQLRLAAYKVFTNKMTVDEAVANYGKF